MEITFFAVCTGLIATLSGGLIMIRALRNAPEGFEDREGFHALQTTHESASFSHREASTQAGGLGLAA